jgi:hypothetical protein
MNNTTSLPTERVSRCAVVAPISSSSASSAVWVSAAGFRRFLATLYTGVLGSSATVDFKLQQAKTSGGGTAKDITGAAITQILKASGDGKIACINLNTDSLDTANGYGYVAMIVTVGTAASLVAATLDGFDAFNDPASLLDPATVVQIVSV